MSDRDKQIKAAIDAAYNAGVKAGIAQQRNSDTSEVLEKLVQALADALQLEDEEQDVQIEIGDLVRINDDDSKSYMVCKITEESILAVDPYKHVVITIDKKEVHGVSKFQSEE